MGPSNQLLALIPTVPGSNLRIEPVGFPKRADAAPSFLASVLRKS